MNIVQQLVFANNVEEFDYKESQLKSDTTVMKYKKFQEYLNRAMTRKVEWALCYQQELLTRGNNTNNLTVSDICV